MWTIAYEFRCYILVALLGVIGGFKSQYRYILLAALIATLIMNGIGVQLQTHGAARVLFGAPDQTVHLTGMFGAGMLYYLFRRHVAYDFNYAHGRGTHCLYCDVFRFACKFFLAILVRISSFGSRSIPKC